MSRRHGQGLTPGISFVHAHGGQLLESLRDLRLAVSGGERSASRQRLCFVPEGAPLFEHRSAVDNVRLLTRLLGGQLRGGDAVHALRCVEVPDSLHGAGARSLPPQYRLAVWLASARLSQADVLALDNPFFALDTEATAAFAALLLEATSAVRHIIVSGPDPSVAQRLSAPVVSARDRSRRASR